VADWKTQKEPASAARADLLAYFGIPPSPESDLEKNIATKRRKWVRLETSNPKGEAIAKRVGATIQQASEALLKGAPMPTPTAAPVEEPVVRATLVPVEDLLDHVTGLIMGGDLRGAMEMATKGQEAYPDSWIPRFAYARVVEVAWGGGELDDPRHLEAAIRSAERALAERPDEPAVWATTASLLGAAGRYDRLDEVVQQAERQLSGLPAGMHLSLAMGLLSRGDVERGLAAAVRAVGAAPHDRAARGDLAATIVEVAARMLPISSSDVMKSYDEAVAVAAWCASGVPEAEAAVLPHRVWAARAGTRVFAGNHVLRTALATYSAFLLLPLHTRLGSRPAWKVLWEGPGGKGRDEVWTLWSFNSQAPYAWQDTFVQRLHHAGGARFPWWHAVYPAV